jgi:hypothetical protein
MNKLTLYTGKSGEINYNQGSSFWASDVKLTDGDLTLTVDEEDVELMIDKKDCKIYSITNFDSLGWIKN